MAPKLTCVTVALKKSIFTISAKIGYGSKIFFVELRVEFATTPPKLTLLSNLSNSCSAPTAISEVPDKIWPIFKFLKKFYGGVQILKANISGFVSPDDIQGTPENQMEYGTVEVDPPDPIQGEAEVHNAESNINSRSGSGKPLHYVFFARSLGALFY